MGIFDKFFGNKATTVTTVASDEQAVVVHLNGSELADDVYQNNDLSTLEDQLIDVLDGTGLGELDGNEMGPEGASIYLYGRNAEMLFAKIEPVLRAYPLCEKARVVIRSGKPGTSQREVIL